ncbi:acyl-CoA dehydrogenase family protein [Streptomyces radiopugnans]|nr:acyl-CoA dehydrogenase family protein [Streptomyces radiopugnans]
MELGTAVSAAREIAEEVLRPQAAAVDTEQRWPAEGMAALLSRLGGLVVPEHSGGMGHGLLAVAQVGEATGRACASTSICFGMHLVGSAVISAQARRRAAGAVPGADRRRGAPDDTGPVGARDGRRVLAAADAHGALRRRLSCG